MFKHSDKFILSVDIGGSHITTALIDLETLKVVPDSLAEVPINAGAKAGLLLLKQFLPAFKTAIDGAGDRRLAGIAVAMPGPFSYDHGVFRLRGLDKFGDLFGLNLKQFLYDQLDIPSKVPIYFKNDADCFGLGAFEVQRLSADKKLIGLTLGTGLGSAFVSAGSILDEGVDLPPGGNLYNQQLKLSSADLATVTDPVEKQPDGLVYNIAEELISSRGILRYINDRIHILEGDSIITDVAEAARIAIGALKTGGVRPLSGGVSEESEGDQHQRVAMICLEAFRVMGLGLAICLKPWYAAFNPEILVIGGGIAGAADLFLPVLRAHLKTSSGAAAKIIVLDRSQMQITPLLGAAISFKKELAADNFDKELEPDTADGLEDKGWRRTHQKLLPSYIRAKEAVADSNAARLNEINRGYDIYPYCQLGEGKIREGFDSLACQMLSTVGANGLIALDGYTGVDWGSFQKGLAAAFKTLGVAPLWIDVQAFAKASGTIETMVAPFLGAQTSVWGTKTDLHLIDLFDENAFISTFNKANLKDWPSELIIVYGTGAGLAARDAPVVFVELPKNEIQYRMRAGKAGNLLTEKRPEFAAMYKRAYFVDWPVLDGHRMEMADRIKIVVDGQWRTRIHWMMFSDLYAGFEQLSSEPIRARPWFAPGAWGGNWMKKHFSQLSKEEVNYAWSFELIVPENGLVFESDGLLLEVPFDWLMACKTEDVLGKDSKTFGHYFPIRFDFLDTFKGGNLSIQCHPSLAYIKEHFGEQITQDETYYILDAAPGAGVYLGFQEGIDPSAFQSELEKSQQENRPIDIQQYVQLLPAHKHDLFLIPNQTVHSAAVNNLVLEISATPYIFTFKMYDWLRPDLNGKPRPINIGHAFKNLNFTRSGKNVEKELCSKPVVLESGATFTRIDLPTHPEHFYAIHRLEIKGSSSESTDGKCHIMMVVEGPGVIVELPDKRKFYYAYAETFIIPAATKRYNLIHPDTESEIEYRGEIKVIKAFIK